MMNRIFSVLLLAAGLMLTGCASYKNINIEEVKLDKIQLQSTSNAIVELKCRIDNPANAKIYLTAVDGFVVRNGANFAQIRLLSSDTLAAKAVSEAVMVFQVELLDPLALLSMGLNISTWDIKDFEINARTTVKTSTGLRKQIKLKKVPLQNLINKF